MSYADTGAGDPIVFLHGNPTSSYLWRNVIPYLAPHARCLAPDLIGMGASGPSATGAYRFEDHARCISTRSSTASISSAMSRWSCTTGDPRWDSIGPRGIRRRSRESRTWRRSCGRCNGRNGRRPAVPIFKALRSPAGDDMILKNNIFVERILPGSVIRKLSDEEMNAYRKPYLSSRASRGVRRCRGRARFRLKASPPTSSRSPTAIRSGWKRAQCRSCSSTPIPARF